MTPLRELSQILHTLAVASRLVQCDLADGDDSAALDRLQRIQATLMRLHESSADAADQLESEQANHQNN